MQLGDIAAAGDCLATLLDPGSAHDDDGEGQTAVRGPNRTMGSITVGSITVGSIAE
jgi:hypothetical protein